MSESGPSPIDDVADALASVGALRDMADRLEDAAVERALREAWSWPQIASALGVTRQAVHKKHAARFEGTDVPLKRRQS